MTILVVGGAGFIGTNFILDWLAADDEPIVNLDKLSYAGSAENLTALEDDPRYLFVQGDMGDRTIVGRLLAEHRPRAIVNFAAESHVDRSISNPETFVHTNIVGTFELLRTAHGYWQALAAQEQASFRFLQVSTDEVYGSLGPSDAPFTETTPYAPNSPYAASKAAADHLVRAYHHTFQLPTLTTNCSNNFGPYQFPEKLIPLVIHTALAQRSLPVYGDGKNIRDWLFVSDHASGIRRVLDAGRPGAVYNIGDRNEYSNIEIVHKICRLLDQMRPSASGPHERLITFVKDRPGHDRRYAIDAGRMYRELNWQPVETFENGLAKTVHWYLDNADWVARMLARTERDSPAGQGKP